MGIPIPVNGVFLVNRGPVIKTVNLSHSAKIITWMPYFNKRATSRLNNQRSFSTTNIENTFGTNWGVQSIGWILPTRIWVSCDRLCHIYTHYCDVIMGAIASQITSLTIVYSRVYSGANQRKHQSPPVTGLCAGNSPVTGEFPHKGPVTRKMFPFDDVIMNLAANDWNA